MQKLTKKGLVENLNGDHDITETYDHHLGKLQEWGFQDQQICPMCCKKDNK